MSAPETINFTRGVPANESFPIADLSACATAALAANGDAMLQYGPSAGLAGLRSWLADWQGVKPEQVREKIVEGRLQKWFSDFVLGEQAWIHDSGKTVGKALEDVLKEAEAIDARIAEIDTRFKTEFPDYASLSSPRPSSAEDVQVDLRPDEALVLIFDTPEWNPTPEETFIWVVTKTDARWVRSEFGTPVLNREVAALRCGLDYDHDHDHDVLA